MLHSDMKKVCYQVARRLTNQEDLISFAVPDVSLQQSPPSYTDREPGLHKAGEQHEEHPMPERNRRAGVHSNPTVLVKNMAVFLL